VIPIGGALVALAEALTIPERWREEIDFHVSASLASTHGLAEELELALGELQPDGASLDTGDVCNQVQLLRERLRIGLDEVLGLLRDHGRIARELAVDEARKNLGGLRPQSDLVLAEVELDLFERIGDHATEQIQCPRWDEGGLGLAAASLDARARESQSSSIGRDELQRPILDLRQDGVHRVAARLARGREDRPVHQPDKFPGLDGQRFGIAES
jgi:hypothetical protein